MCSEVQGLQREEKTRKYRRIKKGLKGVLSIIVCVREACYIMGQMNVIVQNVIKLKG